MKRRSWVIWWLAFALSLSACNECTTGHGTHDNNQAQPNDGMHGTGMRGGSAR